MPPRRKNHQPTIFALVPHPDDPSRYATDSKGKYPSKTHDQDAGTYEKTLSLIGQEQLGLPYLSADARLLRLPCEDEELGPDKIAYLAKRQLGGAALLPEGWEWRQPGQNGKSGLSKRALSAILSKLRTR